MTGRSGNAKSSLSIHVDDEILRAVENGGPVVVFESAVFSHGLPADAARTLAPRLAQAVRSRNATPALIAVHDGRIHVGADPSDIAFLFAPGAMKIAERDLPVALAARRTGGTTVAAALAVAHRIGLRVLATGGIGGVHLGAHDDVSADLHALAHHPLVVVCAGPKIICDMRRTVEVLDTLGVPVVGYQTDEFPAFIVRSSGIPVPHRVETPSQIAAIEWAQSENGASQALLVVQPPPPDAALDAGLVDATVQAALQRAASAGIRGPSLTPFLLGAIAAATGGKSLSANLSLLEANAALAADIAVALAAGGRRIPGRRRPDPPPRRERRSPKGSGRP